jgi:hypothetical protein
VTRSDEAGRDGPRHDLTNATGRERTRLDQTRYHKTNPTHPKAVADNVAAFVLLLRVPVAPGGQKEFEMASIGERCGPFCILNRNNFPIS